VASSWFSYSSVITMMHGPINIRFTCIYYNRLNVAYKAPCGLVSFKILVLSLKNDVTSHSELNLL